MAFYHTILFSLLLASSVTAKYGGLTADLIHRDSPASPSYDPTKTRFDRLRSAFHRSTARKSSLNRHKTTTVAFRDEEAADGLVAPIADNGGEYLMTIALGTPPVEILAIADTGSDLTWTQCQPCTSCYKQRDPIFDPRRSKTYRTLPCSARTCTQLFGSSCGDSNVCAYRYSYGDNSYTRGDVSSETLTIGGSSFRQVAFGCGHENGGTFSPNGSGIVGLGGGPVSIISQLRRSIGGKFSYCLTLLGSDANSTISFGPGSSVSGPGVTSTPLAKVDPDTFYFLTLDAVSVGSSRLHYSKGSGPAAAAAEEEGNIIIDSGTTLTYLPTELYDGLESALVKAVRGRRKDEPTGTFNLCYEKEPGFSAPPVVAHFRGGADVELPAENTFLEVEEGLICLTFVPSQDIAIFGNLHQMNYRVGYDIEGGKVNFLKTDCAKGSE